MFEAQIKDVRFSCPELITMDIPLVNLLIEQQSLSGSLPYCNAMVPLMRGLCVGQSVACVGPFEGCPKLNSEEGPVKL